MILRCGRSIRVPVVWTMVVVAVATVVDAAPAAAKFNTNNSYIDILSVCNATSLRSYNTNEVQGLGPTEYRTSVTGFLSLWASTTTNNASTPGSVSSTATTTTTTECFATHGATGGDAAAAVVVVWPTAADLRSDSSSVWRASFDTATCRQCGGSEEGTTTDIQQQQQQQNSCCSPEDRTTIALDTTTQIQSICQIIQSVVDDYCRTSVPTPAPTAAATTDNNRHVSTTIVSTNTTLSNNDSPSVTPSETPTDAEQNQTNDSLINHSESNTGKNRTGTTETMDEPFWGKGPVVVNNDQTTMPPIFNPQTTVDVSDQAAPSSSDGACNPACRYFLFVGLPLAISLVSFIVVAIIWYDCRERPKQARSSTTAVVANKKWKKQPMTQQVANSTNDDGSATVLVEVLNQPYSRGCDAGSDDSSNDGYYNGGDDLDSVEGGLEPVSVFSAPLETPFSTKSNQAYKESIVSHGHRLNNLLNSINLEQINDPNAATHRTDPDSSMSEIENQRHQWQQQRRTMLGKLLSKRSLESSCNEMLFDEASVQSDATPVIQNHRILSCAVEQTPEAMPCAVQKQASSPRQYSLHLSSSSPAAASALRNKDEVTPPGVTETLSTTSSSSSTSSSSVSSSDNELRTLATIAPWLPSNTAAVSGTFQEEQLSI